MPIYRLTSMGLSPLKQTGFQEQGYKERTDLQRLLRGNIGIVAPDVLVIAEEFADWEDSKRRIDLLAVDRNACLVVIELKRDEDGGHMELQAIRYAAMVSTMTFERAVDVFQAFLNKSPNKQDARSKLIEFLGEEKSHEDEFAKDVRIVLVAANFSKEITTAVLWLNSRSLDIRCVRLQPFANGDHVIVDAQQVVPLPEAQEYIVKLKQKDQAGRVESAELEQLRYAFWKEFIPQAGQATPRFAGLSPSSVHWISASSGFSGVRWSYMAWTETSGFDLYIDRGGDAEWNKSVFDYLHQRKTEIEDSYGSPLMWYRLDDKKASRITEENLTGGVRSERLVWEAIRKNMTESMKRAENAFAPHLENAVKWADQNSANP